MSSRYPIRFPCEIAAATERAKLLWERDLKKAKEGFDLWIQRHPNPHDWPDWYSFAGNARLDPAATRYIWNRTKITGPGTYRFTEKL